MKTLIHPVLLCGGSGTRLWPLSRKAFPKQFSRLTGTHSLFQEAACRLDGDGFAPPTIVTGNEFRFIVAEQLAHVEIAPQAIIIEPEGRNTAPAVLAAALAMMDKDPDALMLVAPSDHAVADAGAFRQAAHEAAQRAREGDLITFGVKPTRPETGYGYLELAEGSTADADHPQALAGFVEKPDAEHAARMMASGNFLWNAGIFLFTARTLIAAYQTHAPDLFAPVEVSLRNAVRDLSFLRLDAAAWRQVPAISIDYAIMEKAPNLAVMPLGTGWSDLGTWDAVFQALGPDAQGNVTSSHTTAIDCRGTLLRSDSERIEVVGIGLEDIVAVATNDAVLIAHQKHAQRVKEAVAMLEAKNVPQAVRFPHDHRPWGSFESLIMGSRFQVKRIVVKPGAALSLQSHHHRAEHWIVVEGTAKVTIGDEVRLLTENQSVYIPLGSVHRLENPGKLPMVLIEVQTGTYLGEDDIIRYEDVYARTQEETR